MSDNPEPRVPIWQRLWSLVDPNERYLRSIQPLVDGINALEPEFERLSQQDLQDRLRKIRSQVAEARDATLAAQAQLDPPTDSDTRRRRRAEIVAAEKAVLDAHLCEVFAAVREAAKRTLGLRHFDVQLLGGIVLHEGRVAEMRTGEGKTLAATCPLVLNALAGRGAHLVTVNDYLARRDAEWMGKIYRYLGLTVGVIQHDMSREARQNAYRCDITYITNHEIGFDYLRDHSSAWRPEHLVLRELYYAIIDEVDSILIDEARVPLIISAARGKPVERYRVIQGIVSRLIQGEQDIETRETTGDFYVDEKAKNATLTEDGQRKVEIALGIDNLNDPENIEDLHLVNAALKANFCYRRDVDYIVGPGDGGVPSVIIVDTFTGRPQPGRRWSDGLHQAIEAKEGVPIQDEQQTIATVTYQNFFLMYDRLSGMTGTAKTEEAEFVGIYEMPVVVVPTNRPMIRVEHPDVVYKNEEWKFRGIVCEIIGLYCRRQPVLVGTRSVETSERLSSLLRPEPLRLILQFLLLQWHLIENEKRIEKSVLRSIRERSSVPLEKLRPRDVAEMLREFDIDPDLTAPANWAKLLDVLEITDEAALRWVMNHGVPHEVLNARYHEREAQIVAQAGRLAAVTIATNMAGRGTDIVLGGNPEPDVEALLANYGIDPKSLSATLFITQALKGDMAAAVAMAEEEGGLPPAVLDTIAGIRAAWQAEQLEVVAVGGLHILGTERHESRRIDNQLRGRSGRQGDPGSARFYVSLQDELMRLFGPDRWSLLMNQWPEEQPVEARLITRTMNNAQRKVEGRNFEMRKNTLRYDDVMNVQRQHIYSERRRILEGVDLRETVSHMMADLVDEALAAHAPSDVDPEEWAIEDLWAALNQRFPLKDQLSIEDLRGIDHATLAERLRLAGERAYDDKENDFIRAVVEFELAASIHETLAQVNDRRALCAVLCLLWPLEDYLPARLAGVPDGRVPEVLMETAREALEAAPRQFILAVVRDRVEREARAAGERVAAGADAAAEVAALEAEWPLDLGPELAATLRIDQAGEQLRDAALAALDARGWSFVPAALRRQIERTIDEAFPECCDLDLLVGEIEAVWPLGEDLTAQRLAGLNYGVIQERLQRVAERAHQTGAPFLRAAAEHQWRRTVELWGDDPAECERRLLALFPPGERPRALPEGDRAELVSEYLDELVEGLALRAVEEAAVASVVAIHRTRTAGEEEGEEEELEAGDLQRMIERIAREWPVGDVLNPWELERLEPSELRREMTDLVRAEVQSRGPRFITDTARLRLTHLLSSFINEHYSLAALCARLSRDYELPGAFDPRRYEGHTNVRELTEALLAEGTEWLADDPDRLIDFAQQIPGRVDEGYNAGRLCDRVNRELRPPEPLKVNEVVAVPADELLDWLIERLQPTVDALAEQVALDAVRDHVLLTVDSALGRHYDVRRLSGIVGQAWPVRPDTVRPSKLKGWTYQELPSRLKAVLFDAYQAEEWRFMRGFAYRHLKRGLDEALADWCPPDARPNEWDIPSLCDDLARRWRLDEPPDPRSLPDMSWVALRDALFGVARHAYGEAERAFVRETARHRFAQRLARIRTEHYSLDRAADELNRAWGLGDAVDAAMMARSRQQLAEGASPADLAAAVEPFIEAAEATLLRQAVERRLRDSVDDVLRDGYNTTRLVRALVGRWPLSRSVLSPTALRRMPYRELVDGVRQTIAAADGPLQRRVVFHNLRESVAEIDLGRYLPADDPTIWQVGPLIAELATRVPFGEQTRAAEVAGRILELALDGEVGRAPEQSGGADSTSLAAVLKRAAEADLDALMAAERRPQAVRERLDARWPLDDRVDPSSLRGKSAAEVRSALKSALDRIIDADPERVLATAARRWALRQLDEAIARHWREGEEPGPWALARICAELGEAWGQSDRLRPSHYKNLEREQLAAALAELVDGLPAGDLNACFLASMAQTERRAVARAAGAAAVAREDGPWDWSALLSTLAERWVGEPVDPRRVAALLNHEVAATALREAADGLARRVVREYGSEEVQTWLGHRIDRALERHCSLRLVCGQLEMRWPLSGLDPNRLAGMAHQELRDALYQAGLEAARADYQGFIAATARRRLEADIEAVLAAVDAGESLESACAGFNDRWPVKLDPALRALDADTLGSALRAVAAEIDEAALQQAFLYETMRRQLRQSVEEAQAAHCNPEIASDRWEHEAFVAALERLWPFSRRLDPADLRPLGADELARVTREALRREFDADPAGFVRATARLRLCHGVADALAEHASLSRLCERLTQEWPRSLAWDPTEVAQALDDELAEVLTDSVTGTGGGDDEAVFQSIEALVAKHRTASGVDRQGLLAEVAAHFGRPSLSPLELDERLVDSLLERRLWDDFVNDPRAFVRAVALEDVPRQLERRLMLEAIDTNWCDHLEAMDYLREGINLRGYGQTDPFIAYRKDGRQMFENMLGRIRETVVTALFGTTDYQLVEMHRHGRLGLQITVEFRNVQELASKAEELTASHGDSAGGEGPTSGARLPAGGGASRQPVVVGRKVGRNDPCPCGSGRKYKHCCGRRQ